MTLLASLPRIEEQRVSVVFDCPKCHCCAVRGTAYNLRETIRLSERVPAWGWKSSWVRCSHCQAELVSDREPKKFVGASSATVTDCVHTYQSFPKRVLAVASLAIGWAPVIGVLVALAATAANLKTSGWPRVLSVVALVLTGVFNAVLFGSLIYWSIKTAQPLTM